MSKQVNKGIEKFVEGAIKASKIVGSTMGARGKNVIIDKGYGAPDITNDGITVLSHIEFDDEQEQKGKDALQDAAGRTNQEVGDNTSATAVLGGSTLEEGIKHLNEIGVMSSLNKTTEKLVETLKTISKPTKTRKDLLNVATISAESPELAEVVVDLYENLGDNASITAETKIGQGIEVQVSEGYEIKTGLVVESMANQGKSYIQSNVKCFVVTGKLAIASEIQPFIEKLIVQKKIKELVIFCEDMDPGLINFFKLNKDMGLFVGIVVRAQSQNNELLEDIALVTGATLVKRDTGVAIETLDPNVLGTAKEIYADTKITQIRGGKGSVKAKIKELSDLLQTTKDENAYDLIENRIARLESKVAVVRVGAKNEGGANYWKDKAVDAISAVKSAKEEGIVEGGGLTFYNLAQSLDNSTLGNRIMRKALLAPMRNIVENAEKDFTDILVNMPKGKGYDVVTETYVDMFKAGIVDTAKGVRCAIENAVSFAASSLPSGYVIYNKKEKDE